MNLTTLAFLAFSVGCSNGDDKATQPTRTPEARPAAVVDLQAPTKRINLVAKPVSAVAGELPPECSGYREVARLAARCDPLGSSRTLLTEQFETKWKAWSELPAEQRGQLGKLCRSAETSLKAAIASPCGL